MDLRTGAGHGLRHTVGKCRGQHKTFFVPWGHLEHFVRPWSMALRATEPCHLRISTQWSFSGLLERQVSWVHQRLLSRQSLENR
eukprot:18148_2